MFNGLSFRPHRLTRLRLLHVSCAHFTKPLRELDHQCGIDPVVNCIRGTRVDANASAVSDNVPIVAVINSLERYGDPMSRKARRTVFADHACVTTSEPSVIREALFKDRLSESEKVAKQLIIRNCRAEKRGVRGWFRRGEVLLGD